MGPILYASVFLIVYNTEPTVFAESVCSSSKIRERTELCVHVLSVCQKTVQVHIAFDV